jgi:ubiquinone/menaquinone biosynthesis C-methylase UbiE
MSLWNTILMFLQKSKIGIYLFALVVFPFCLHAQKKNKVNKLPFCGWQLNDKKRISSNFKEQFDFLHVNEGDTIVDIGAQSGTYEGCFLAVNNFKTVRFILVDIDTSCLNGQKVNNMIAHYSKVKGDSIRNSFQIVQNTPDSLWLPLNAYRKVWLFNTLHEIPDQQKMVKDIKTILKQGGEITILEIPAKYEGQLHGGCHQPLLTLEKINALFSSNGFRFIDKKLVARKKHFDVFMARYIKE